MFKSIPSVSRSITACAVLVVAVCFGGCSTKSQLVGTWSDDALSKSIPGGSPISMAQTWEFFSDNTCRMSKFTRSGECKYRVLDDGSIKIEFQGGATVTGKLENKKLILNPGKEQTVLYKFR